MPLEEHHLVEMMLHQKHYREIDGKATYQYHKYERALQFVPKKRRRVALDIGAHVGLWSMHMVKDFETVWAFEPNEAMASIFPWNVRGNAHLNTYALGDRMGRCSLAVKASKSGMAHITDGDDIPMIRLDQLDIRDVDFIKIDVEGYEAPVIRGGEDTIRKCKPIIICEQKNNEVRHFGGQEREATKLLESWGAKQLDNLANDIIFGWS